MIGQERRTINRKIERTAIRVIVNGSSYNTENAVRILIISSPGTAKTNTAALSMHQYVMKDNSRQASYRAETQNMLFHPHPISDTSSACNVAPDYPTGFPQDLVSAPKLDGMPLPYARLAKHADASNSKIFSNPKPLEL